MSTVLCRTSLCLFGAGGTQGGVKKATVAKFNYNNWAQSSQTRALLATIHHPLVVEYFMRLYEKSVSLEGWLGSHSGSEKPEHVLVNAVDGSPFDFVQWNAQYRDELDVAECMSRVVRQLDENVALRDQLAAKQHPSSSDVELLEMVREEVEAQLAHVQSMDAEVDQKMRRRIGADDAVGSSSRTWKVSVEGKAGGEEASLFAAELADLYKTYAREILGFKVKDLGDVEAAAADGSHDRVSLTGFANRFEISGDDVYRYFRHEIGVHKVQRVPVTDASGKMQTSTAVFTIMPELDPVSVDVRESDCNIDFVRGSGPGGQGMQSSSNCVVALHRPSGISVKCHQSRSALGNKELALQTIAQQILAQRIRAQNSSLHDAWSNQWSSGERSDKMRTYNYPQNRVTDHRVGKDYPLTTFMERGHGLKKLHDLLNEISDCQQLNSVLLKHINGGFGSKV